MRVGKNPNYDAVCFHVQQCAEKYLKARLQEEDIEFSRTHNLVALLDLMIPTEPLWESFRPILQTLSVYAINVRYPGESIEKEEAHAALKLCRRIRKAIRISLKMEI